VWQEVHEQEFKYVCQVLTSDLVVKPFNPRLKTRLLTDAARLYGLGYLLLQHEPIVQEDGSVKMRPRLVQCGLQLLTPTQLRYATIELETLGIAWAMEKCNYYLLGMPELRVVTDHKPILGIFNKPIHEVPNPRLQRFREKLAPYTFKLE